MLTHVNTDRQKREIARPRHPDQHIARAIQDAEKLGWMVVLSNGHAWGRLFCSDGSRDGCIVSVWSTPRVPENHARQIRREIDLCPRCRLDDTGEAIKSRGVK
jgi:hypothetical protein